MPELPEMQALSERLDALLAGTALTRAEPLGFTALKTVVPSPDSLVGVPLTGVGRRGKYLVFSFDGGARLLVHLSQAGRLDVESPPKATRPRGAVARLTFEGGRALLVREHGTQRKAGWWVLGPGDDGPLATLGPEATDPATDELIRTDQSPRQVHTWLRDQRTVAGIGRGYADDIVHRARLSPFAAVRSLTPDQREALRQAVHEVLDEALAAERQRSGGLSEPRLGDRFTIHNRAGQPCPRCGETLQRVSFDSHEISYCPTCQTKGRVLADRRLSRLLR